MQTNASGFNLNVAASSSSAATADALIASTSAYVLGASNFAANGTTDLLQWSGAGREGSNMKARLRRLLESDELYVAAAIVLLAAFAAATVWFILEAALAR